jgi:pimeloyl-ACP methyl ester carboxylesterase
VPIVVVDGIATSYVVCGSGPPLLLLSPGGFDARMANWSGHELYARLNLVEHLARSYTCILFDKRESGGSGGRVERLSWAAYVAQGLGLLEQLGFASAHLVGGCVGCSIALAAAAAFPGRVESMVLYSPAGGPRYRLMQHERFARHLAFVAEHGPDSVVALARDSTAGFAQDARLGPWAGVLRRDDEAAAAFRALPADRYRAMVLGSAALLFDRDTVPGAEAEDLMALDTPALIVPGQDASHATSAARYLQECLRGAHYWDAPVAEQTEQNAPGRILEFLGTLGRAPSSSGSTPQGIPR